MAGSSKASAMVTHGQPGHCVASQKVWLAQQQKLQKAEPRHKRTRTCAHTYIQLNIYTCAHMCACTHIHTRAHMCIHMHIHKSHTHKCSYTHTHKYTHIVHMHIIAYTSMCKNIYTHIYCRQKEQSPGSNSWKKKFLESCCGLGQHP